MTYIEELEQICKDYLLQLINEDEFELEIEKLNKKHGGC